MAGAGGLFKWFVRFLSGVSALGDLPGGDGRSHWIAWGGFFFGFRGGGKGAREVDFELGCVQLYGDGNGGGVCDLDGEVEVEDGVC